MAFLIWLIYALDHYYPDRQRLAIRGTNIQIRKTPSINGERLMLVSQPDSVTYLFAKDDIWCCIELKGGQHAYVARQFLLGAPLYIPPAVESNVSASKG